MKVSDDENDVDDELIIEDGKFTSYSIFKRR